MIASSGLGLKLWNLETFELIKEYPINGRTKQPAQINSFHVRSDNAQLASVVDMDYIKLIDFEQKTFLDINEMTDVRCCSYDSTGRYLAAGTTRGCFDLFDFKASTFKKRSVKIPSSTCVNCICFSRNDRFLATGNSNGAICLYNTITNTFNKPLIYPQHAKSLHPPNVTSIHYSALNTGSLSASYEDGSIIIWDVSKEQATCAFKEHTSTCTSIVSSPINAILMVSGGLDNVFIMYDTTTRKVIKSVSCPGGITSLEILKNGSTLGVGTANGYLLMYDLRNTETGPYLSTKAHDSSVYCVKFIQPNREKLSVINSNLQPVHEHSVTMKRSNSYNNEVINPKINYNIYSPEPVNNYNHAHINSSTNNETTGQTIVFQNNQVNQLNSGESFILHKKNTSNTSLNSSNQVNSKHTAISTPVMPGNNIHELSSNMPNVNVRKPDLKINQVKQTNNIPLRSKLTNDMLSPISSNHHKTEHGILSSTAQTTNGTILDMSKNPKIQIDDSNCNRSIRTSPKNVRSPSVSKQNGYDIDMNDNNQVVTIPVEHLKELIKETVKETLKEHNEKIENNRQHQAVSGMPLDKLKQFIKETVEDCHDDLMSENFKFKIEIFKEFTQLEEKLTKKIESSSLNPDLLEEISRLKEEIKRLKSQF